MLLLFRALRQATVICLLLLATHLLPAQNAGNTCATAGVITTNGSYAFNTTGASANDPCSPLNPTVWYRFTATKNGTVNADLCGSSFNTYLTAFAGDTCPVGCTGVVAANDNFCGTASAISFTATAGTTYYFAVRGVLFSNSGPGVFNFQFIPDGDTCVDAIEVTTNGSYLFDTTGASPDDPCAAVPTVWFRFTAPFNGTVNADLCGSSYDTWLTIWAGPTCPASCAGSIQSNNYACGLASAVSFPITAGTTYHFSVSGTLPSSFGPGVFNFEFIRQPGDACDLAVEITTNGSYPFDTTGASGDDPCLAGVPTVWYRFKAPTNGLVNADLCGSSFNTYLTAFAGEACPASCTGIVVGNDDSCGTASAISFAATQGTTYYFAVSGSEGVDFGSGVFNLQFLPFGDTCDDAIEVASGSSTSFDLTAMSAGDDPCFPPEFRTLWFRYTAPTNGVVTADTCGSSFNTFMQGFVSPGCPVPCADRVASNSNSCGMQSLVSFNIEQGQTAYLVVGGFSSGDAGPGVMNLTFVSDPPVPLLGDFNLDGIVNVADVTAFSRWLRSDRDTPVGNVDVNGDGVLNELDVQSLAEMIVGNP